jgi:photosystem I subunit 4
MVQTETETKTETIAKTEIIANKDDSILAKGARVRILRKESYWFNKVGTVISVEKDDIIRYPIVVRFDAVNYSGTNTNNFSVPEVEIKVN